eukprot:3095726-Lingulodinium_polyedra.AAC.1
MELPPPAKAMVLNMAALAPELVQDSARAQVLGIQARQAALAGLVLGRQQSLPLPAARGRSRSARRTR